MELLQEALDDPSAASCGRCSVCLGGLPDGLAAVPSARTVQAVTELLRGEIHHLEPRKMWPGGAFGARGKIKADEQAEVGRTLVYADAPEWRETVAAMFERDRPAPQVVLDACVRVLADWRSSWVARPEVVVGLPAGGYPELTASVADHLAGVGRLSRVPLEVAGPPLGLRDLGSPEEAAYWNGAIAEAEGVVGRVVLLVCDASASLWPLTVAGAKLRHAGARAVLPLLLHRRP